MSNYQRIAEQLANWRAQAHLIPTRIKPRSKIQFSTDISRIAFGLGMAITALLFGYANYWLGINYWLADLEYAARYGILVFAFIFSLPLLGRAISWNHQHRMDASEMMNDVWFFPYHFCLILLLAYAIIEIMIFVLPYIVAVWNVFTHSEITLYFTPTGLYQVWLLGSVLITVAYEARLVFTPWQRNSKQTTRQYLPFGLWIGKSTGLLGKRSHGAGLKPNQHIALSLHDATHHILVLGGTGAGKTTRLINPLLLQLIAQDCGGLIFDIKGDFYKTVYKFVEDIMGDNHRVVLLGIGGLPINLIEGLTPEMAGSFLKSTLLLSDARTDGFWTDTATTLCTNILGLLFFLPDKYNLISLYDYLFNSQFKANIHAEIEALKPILTDNQLRALNSYHDYIEHAFESFEEKTRNGVKATAAQVLRPLVQAPALVDAFCHASGLNMEDMINKGTIYLINLPLSDWGLGGKVVYNFIKMRFFNVMQKRNNQSDWNQERPVFFMCDEYQQIATGDKDSLSDLNFWDTARTTKTIGIISAQSISSFYAAFGNRDIANAVLQNFRQKICFRSEDERTLEFLNRVIGTVEIEKKSFSKQHGSSSKNIGEGVNTHRSKSESVSYGDKPVVDAQLIRNLEPNQAVAILVMQGYSCDDVLDTITC